MDILKCFDAEPAGKISEISDKNDLYVLRKCIEYLRRHFLRFSKFDQETFKLVCWILGEEMIQLGNFVLQFIKGKNRSEFKQEIEGSELDPDDYADILANGLRKCERLRPGKLARQVRGLLKKRLADLRYAGQSEIEKNMMFVREMFGLTDREVGYVEFLFIMDTFSQAEAFFSSHLECHKYAGRKYLENFLGFSNGDLYRVNSGTLKRIGMLDIDHWGICIENEFVDLIQNPSEENMQHKYFTRITGGVVPLDHYFTLKEQIRHISGLLEAKAKSATHILLYGPPGTGKTSFAHSLLNQLDLTAYEIVRGDENTTQNRRAAITACLNMTGSGRDSVIVVDEADNLLSTQGSYFLRGETQDKGWLNELLERPGTTMIWITNNLYGIEDSVMRRFAYSLHFKPFKRSQRLLLWENILRRNKCKRFLDRKNLSELALKYEANAGVIDLAVRKTIERGIASRSEFRHEVEMALQAHEILKHHGEKPPRKERIENNFSLEGLNVSGDLGSVMAQLKAFNEHQSQLDQSEAVNLNLLFYGPPGTGKSELARYISDQLDRKTICKRVSDLQSMYVGEGEKNIARAFAEAESEEAVLIIDEADSLLFSRDRAVRSWEISFTNEFLTRMESFRGILVCTTNRLNDLDRASLRRFIYKIEFDYLNPRGNAIFYEMFLSPLTSKGLGTEMRTRLKAIRNLAPGDFKVVRNRYRFHPKGNILHQTLIEALEEEANLKCIHDGGRAIGF